MIITFPQIMTFFLIVARFAGLMLTAPILSDKRIFMLAKISFVFWFAGLAIFVVPLPAHLPTTGITYVLATVVELFLGAMIGFIADILVTGIEFAGSLMDTQAGLSVSSMLDPGSGKQITLFSALLKWVSLMIFLAIDGHHMILTALYESFRLLPIGSPINLAEGCRHLFGLGTYIFFIGVQLAAPILLIVFLIDFGFGILNKVAEQINVFQLGFQIKPSACLFIFFAITPGLTGSIYRIMEGITEHLLKLYFTLQMI